MISSFRTNPTYSASGWWSVFPARESVITGRPMVPPNLTPTAPTRLWLYRHLRGVFTHQRIDDGTQLTWLGNRRRGRIEVQQQEWVTDPGFTLDNYRNVLLGKEYTVADPDGTSSTEIDPNLTNAFLNSLVVTIPSTVIPIVLAAFAAYGFAWMRFPARKMLFVLVVALLVVPLQIALVPILRLPRTGVTGAFLAVWLAHTGFGLPLAIFLLYNYIRQLPHDILESAFIDGASHFTIFTRLILPLSVPALASFAIFQFLWVWNDYLVALVFLGGNPDFEVITVRLAEIVGLRGHDWHLLTAGPSSPWCCRWSYSSRCNASSYVVCWPGR